MNTASIVGILSYWIENNETLLSEFSVQICVPSQYGLIQEPDHSWAGASGWQPERWPAAVPRRTKYPRSTQVDCKRLGFLWSSYAKNWKISSFCMILFIFSYFRKNSQNTATSENQPYVYLNCGHVQVGKARLG